MIDNIPINHSSLPDIDVDEAQRNYFNFDVFLKRYFIVNLMYNFIERTVKVLKQIVDILFFWDYSNVRNEISRSHIRIVYKNTLIKGEEK